MSIIDEYGRYDRLRDCFVFIIHILLFIINMFSFGDHRKVVVAIIIGSMALFIIHLYFKLLHLEFAIQGKDTFKPFVRYSEIFITVIIAILSTITIIRVV